MLRQQFYVKTFGTIRTKIWCYPKDVLKSLLLGLRRNSNTVNRVFDILSFNHRYDNINGFCNCSDKIEDICMKFSVNAQQFNKIFIPLELFDNENDCYKCFICEIKSLNMNYCDHNNGVIVANDKLGTVNCLMKLKYDKSYNCVDNFMSKADINHIKNTYEDIIKDLISKNCCKQYETHTKWDEDEYFFNKNKLLADTHDKFQGKKSNKFESNSIHFHHNPNSYHTKSKKFQIRPRSPTNHYYGYDEYCSKSSRSPSPCTDEHINDKILMKTKSTQQSDKSDIEVSRNDISEIKCLLRELMKIISHDEIKLDSRANGMLKKYLYDIKCKMKKFKVENDQDSNGRSNLSENEELVDNCFKLRHQIYSSLPNLIPTVPHKINTDQVPIIDAYSNGNATENYIPHECYKHHPPDYSKSFSMKNHKGPSTKESILKGNDSNKNIKHFSKKHFLQFDPIPPTKVNLSLDPSKKHFYNNDDNALKLPNDEQEDLSEVKALRQNSGKSSPKIPANAYDNSFTLNESEDNNGKSSSTQTKISWNNLVDENQNVANKQSINFHHHLAQSSSQKKPNFKDDKFVPHYNYIL